MSSKRRLRRKECEGKRRYLSHAEAHAQASRSGDAAGGRYIEPYECGFCGGWHIGHRPGAMREHTELYGEFLKRERWKQI